MQQILVTLSKTVYEMFGGSNTRAVFGGGNNGGILTTTWIL